MITVSPIDGSYNQGFEIKGHAGYAEHGHDIVCAGVSASAYTTFHSLEHCGGKANIKAKFHSGHTRVEVVTEIPSTSRVIQGFLDFMKQLDNKYPGRVEIKNG